jgi:hypothetical protein
MQIEDLRYSKRFNFSFHYEIPFPRLCHHVSFLSLIIHSLRQDATWYRNPKLQALSKAIWLSNPLYIYPTTPRFLPLSKHTSQHTQKPIL